MANLNSQTLAIPNSVSGITIAKFSNLYFRKVKEKGSTTINFIREVRNILITVENSVDKESNLIILYTYLKNNTIWLHNDQYLRFVTEVYKKCCSFFQ